MDVKVGDNIDYGMYSNVVVKDIDSEHCTLVDRHGNTKKVYAYLVQENAIYHGDCRSKQAVLLRNGEQFSLSQISKSSVSIKRLLAMLNLELIHQSNPELDYETLLERRLNQVHKQNLRQYSMCKTILTETVLPEISLRKALAYLGMHDVKMKDIIEA